VPALPGALSALGILVSDVVKDYSRTILWRVADKLPYARLVQEFAALQKQAAKDFKKEAWTGKAHYPRSVDIRYHGQGYELNLPFTANLLKDFQREHQRRYGYAHTSRAVELVTLRLRAIVKSPKVEARMGEVGTAATGRPGRAKLDSPSMLKAQVLFEGKKLRTAIYTRDDLNPGKKYSGPAIINEYSATTVIPPSKPFHVDAAGTLLVRIR
jgi:N-methylhydantoinase A